MYSTVCRLGNVTYMSFIIMYSLYSMYSTVCRLGDVTYMSFIIMYSLYRVCTVCTVQYVDWVM